MPNQLNVVNASNAASFIGQTVLMELVWEQDPEPIWRCFHVLGFVLPIEGVFEHGYLLTMDLDGKSRYPDETFFSSIRTIRAIGHCDRQSSGRMTGPIQDGSRTALRPATFCARPSQLISSWAVGISSR
ncbi:MULTISPECIES: hypothetical protein [Pseudomonas]|uniref:hypothetical protein n=1 Tax=Pseudomonas sp. MEJ086 TaxID=3040319 RepID=UPI0012E0A57E|nr:MULTISPECIES: hypothetical protein [Pseudomonas]